MKTYDAVVIGAGPAGLTAAIYLRRFLRDIVLIHAGRPRATWIPRCHNLIGFDQGITGPELLSNLWKQVTDLETETLEANAKVRHDGHLFEITAGDRIIHAKKVIFATGIRDRQPEWENVFELRKAGLLRYCPVCDSYEHQHKKLVVVADSAHGIREALFLARFTKDILLILPKDLEIPEELQKFIALDGLEYTRESVQSVEIQKEGDESVLQISFEKSPPRIFQAAYIALGIEVNQDAFSELGPLEMTEDGLLKVASRQELSVPGSFAIGDCVEGLAQISVAAGQAAVAAMAVHNQLRLEEKEIPPKRVELAGSEVEIWMKAPPPH